MTKAQIQAQTKPAKSRSKPAESPTATATATAVRWQKQRQAVQPLDDAALADIKTRFAVDGQLAVVAWAPNYCVSDGGRVFSNRPKLDGTGEVQEIKVTTEKATGYRQVNVYSDGEGRRNVRLHKLVAEAFVANPDGHPLVLHKDDNPENNAASNLYWGTPTENAADAIRNGKSPTGERHPAAKASNAQVAAIRMLHELGHSITELAKELGYSPEYATKIAKRRHWKNVPSGKDLVQLLHAALAEQAA